MKNRSELESYAEKYYYDMPHSRQVLKLCEFLFDSLASLHGLPKSYLTYLQEAALLHDIGLCNGASGHHKSSSDILLADPPDCIEPDRLAIVACIARYHRKALPSPSHSLYAQLPAQERKVVEKLAAILRIADGLDYTHDSWVKSIQCSTGKDNVEIQLTASRHSRLSVEQAMKKSDLFTQVFNKNISIYVN